MPDRVNDVIVLLRLEESITNLNICSNSAQPIASGWDEESTARRRKKEKIGKMKKVKRKNRLLVFC